MKYGNIRTILLQKEKELQPIPAQLTHRQWLDMSAWKEQFDLGEEVYVPWLHKQIDLIVGMVESDETREFVGDIELIRKKLDIDDTTISKQGWYLRQLFVGRKWLTEKIENWLDDPNGGHLCAVYGGPGTGKSAFAAQYVYRSPRAAASLFFEHGNLAFNSPDAIVRELIFQLACRLPQYRSRLVYKLQEQSTDHAQNTQELFQSMFAVPLQEAIDGGHETLCVVIDGLDECGEDGKRLAAQLLSEEKFPKWLRVVVLTRPENTVTAHLKPDMEIRMDEEEDATRADVREYFSLRLEKQLKDQPNKDKLLDRLTVNADGVFLYAYIVTDMILKDKLSLDKPEEYPRDLNMSFETWFSRYFPDADEFNRLYKLPLGIIASCAKPIPVEELDALNARYDPYECVFVLMEENKNARRQSVVKLLERCAVLLKYEHDKFGEKTVLFSHRYIGEWMTKTSEENGQSASRTYFCDPSDACWVLEKSWQQKLECGEELTDYEALHLIEMMRKAGETWETVKIIGANPVWEQKLDTRYKQLKETRIDLSRDFAWERAELLRRVYGINHPFTLQALNECNALEVILEEENFIKNAKKTADNLLSGNIEFLLTVESYIGKITELIHHMEYAIHLEEEKRNTLIHELSLLRDLEASGHDLEAKGSELIKMTSDPMFICDEDLEKEANEAFTLISRTRSELGGIKETKTAVTKAVTKVEEDIERRQQDLITRYNMFVDFIDGEILPQMAAKKQSISHFVNRIDHLMEQVTVDLSRILFVAKILEELLKEPSVISRDICKKAMAYMQLFQQAFKKLREAGILNG